MIIGIDPGLNGALAVASNGRLDAVRDLPTLRDGKRTRLDVRSFATKLCASRTVYGARHVYLEHVGAMPQQGSGSAFNFGRTYGEIRGVLIALGFTLHEVTPQTWKFAFGLRAAPGTDTRTRKNASREKAIELFPERAHLFQRVKDDGRAEAALIALYGEQVSECAQEDKA